VSARFGKILAGFAAATLMAAVATAPLYVRGRSFGSAVERALPEIAGRVEVSGGRWSWSSLWALLRQRPADVELWGVHVVDPDGIEVLRVGRLVARVELHRAARTAIVHDLRLDGVVWRLAENRRGPGVGLANALAARRGASEAKPFSLTIPDAVVYRLAATFDFADWGLTLDDVRALTASLSLSRGAGGAATLAFEVRDADVRRGGLLRVGPVEAPWKVALSSAHIARVATVEGAPDTLALQVREIRFGESEASLSATFRGVFGAPGDAKASGLELKVEAVRAAELVRALVARWMPGPALTVGGAGELRGTLEGPYADPRVVVEASGFNVDFRALHLAGVRFHLDAKPTAPRLRFDLLSAEWRDVGTVEGGLSLETEDGLTSIRRVALKLTRPEGGIGPRVLGMSSSGAPASATLARPALGLADLRIEGGVLRVPRVTVPLWGGRLEARGKVTFQNARTGRWLTSPLVDVTFAARGLEIGRAIGPRFVRGSIACSGRATGPLRDVAFDLDFPRTQTLTVFGETLALPPRTSFVVTQGSLYVHLPLWNARGRKLLSADGRVDLTGRLDLGVEVRDFPLERLPGVATAGLGVGGELSGKLHLANTVDAPWVAGRLSLFPVTLQGHDAGHGALTITTEDGEELHAYGRLMDGVDLDGRLRVGAEGARGRATLRLQRVRLALPAPPAAEGIAVAAAISGTLEGRFGPGGDGAIEGSLSEVALSVRRATGPGLELRAVSPVPVSAPPQGALHAGPARFTGAAGELTLTVEQGGPLTTAALRGRVELAALGPFLSPWMTRPEGAVLVDLAMRASGQGGGSISLSGPLTVARPVSFRLVAAPVTVRVPAGGVRFTGNALEAAALPVSFAAELSPKGAITAAEGSVRLDARLSAGPAPSRLRLDVQRLALSAPLVSALPIVATRGSIELQPQLDALDETTVRYVDLPLEGRAAHVTTPAGMIDRATFALLLRGVPGRTLTLSGDVDILAARLRPERLQAAAAAAHTDPSPLALRNPRLDLRVRSRGQGVAVDLRDAPDLHVQLDLRAGGTVERPVVTGEARPTGVYSAVVMTLQRLFR
jgi:hypothetical protein